MKMPRTVCLMAAPLVLILSQASFLLASEETPKRFDFDTPGCSTAHLSPLPRRSPR